MCRKKFQVNQLLSEMHSWLHSYLVQLVHYYVNTDHGNSRFPYPRWPPTKLRVSCLSIKDVDTCDATISISY